MAVERCVHACIPLVPLTRRPSQRYLESPENVLARVRVRSRVRKFEAAEGDTPAHPMGEGACEGPAPGRTGFTEIQKSTPPIDLSERGHPTGLRTRRRKGHRPQNHRKDSLP